MMELFRANASIHTNPAFISTLASSVSVGATSFTVASGAGASLPSPTGGDYFRLRIGTDSAPEVVRVTARSGDVCTCDALQASHAAGDAAVWTVSGETLEGFRPSTATFEVAPYLEYLVLSLSMDGANNSVSFVDKKGHKLTPNGDAKISTAQYKYGGASAYFDGSGDSLQTANDPVFNFGTGDFTVEFWMYTPVAWTSQPAACGIISNKLNDGSSGWVLYRDGGGPSKINARLGGQNNFFTASTPAVNTWEHWELSRAGTTAQWFKNGVADASATSTANLVDNSATFYIGFSQVWSGYLNAYIDELNIYNGVALHTSGFTPRSTALFLPPVGSYYMRGWDGTKYVYWGSYSITATPSQTWPAASGTVTDYTPLFMQTVNGKLLI